METKQQVVVTDIKMSFLSMVAFMVKWVIAAIPAFLILMAIFFTIASLTTALYINPLMNKWKTPALTSGNATLDTSYYIVKVPVATGREAPNVSSKVIGMFNQGEKLKRISTAGPWSELATRFGICWVLSRELEKAPKD